MAPIDAIFKGLSSLAAGLNSTVSNFNGTGASLKSLATGFNSTGADLNSIVTGLKSTGAGLSSAVTGMNNSSFSAFNTNVGQFIADHTLIWHWLQVHAAAFLAWFTQPHVLLVITTWWVTFTVILILLSFVGFNPVGVGAGTIAAAFQSWAYGGFTPAGGVFATLTSLGMLGFLMPIEVGVGAVLATAVAAIVGAIW